MVLSNAMDTVHGSDGHATTKKDASCVISGRRNGRGSCARVSLERTRMDPSVGHVREGRTNQRHEIGSHSLTWSIHPSIDKTWMVGVNSKRRCDTCAMVMPMTDTPRLVLHGWVQNNVCCTRLVAQAMVRRVVICNGRRSTKATISRRSRKTFSS